MSQSRFSFGAQLSVIPGMLAQGHLLANPQSGEVRVQRLGLLLSSVVVLQLFEKISPVEKTCFANDLASLSPTVYLLTLFYKVCLQFTLCHTHQLVCPHPCLCPAQLVRALKYMLPVLHRACLLTIPQVQGCSPWMDQLCISSCTLLCDLVPS